MPKYSFVFAALMAFASRAQAEVPDVVTDIAPVHSMVAQVMQGVGAPQLILTPGSSPHGYSLRPSQARDMQNADLVVWIGDELTPWLVKPLQTLAAGAEQLELLHASATKQLMYRGDLSLEEEDDDHDDDHDNDHDTAHDHGDDHSDDHGDDHDHEGTDPHAWLDPQNGRIWLHLIADRLGQIDPENAQTYSANAAAAAARLDLLQAEIARQLEPMADRPFVAYHDAYQYFENRFDLHLAGTIARGDAADPGPARLARLRDVIEHGGISCAFTEPQLNGRRLETVAETAPLKILVLDPLGANATPGPDLYETVLRGMAESFADCARD